MTPEDELVDLERSGWEVVSSCREATTIFYGHVLDEAPVMLLPGGLRLTDRDDILQSMSGQPWSSYDLRDPHVLLPADDVGVVTYEVVARRGRQTYEALVSSHYVRRDGSWKLFFHQQTPR